MRVSAGRLKGHKFSSRRLSGARPMSERIKQAMFNALGDISGLSVLDAFGGSGALAAEAISRGAAWAVICENNRSAANLIAGNVASLGLADKIKLYRLSVYRFLAISDDTFDLVLADPPFAEFAKLKMSAFTSVMRPGAMLILSAPAAGVIPSAGGLRLLRSGHYGSARLIFYKRLDHHLATSPTTKPVE
jgi:16S rRNA (guanine966-N2)-methyltransferase